MVVVFHQYKFAHGNRYPVYVVAEGIQAIEYDSDGTLLHMVGGPEVTVSEDVPKVLKRLAEVLPAVWGGYRLEQVEYNEDH